MLTKMEKKVSKKYCESYQVLDKYGEVLGVHYTLRTARKYLNMYSFCRTIAKVRNYQDGSCQVVKYYFN